MQTPPHNGERAEASATPEPQATINPGTRNRTTVRLSLTNPKALSLFKEKNADLSSWREPSQQGLLAISTHANGATLSAPPFLVALPGGAELVPISWLNSLSPTLQAANWPAPGSLCWWCNRHPASLAHTYECALESKTTQSGLTTKKTTWRTANIFIARCPACAATHQSRDARIHDKLKEKRQLYRTSYKYQFALFWGAAGILLGGAGVMGIPFAFADMGNPDHADSGPRELLISVFLALFGTGLFLLQKKLYGGFRGLKELGSELQGQIAQVEQESQRLAKDVSPQNFPLVRDWSMSVNELNPKIHTELLPSNAP